MMPDPDFLRHEAGYGGWAISFEGIPVVKVVAARHMPAGLIDTLQPASRIMVTKLQRLNSHA